MHATRFFNGPWESLKLLFRTPEQFSGETIMPGNVVQGA